MVIFVNDLIINKKFFKVNYKVFLNYFFNSTKVIKGPIRSYVINRFTRLMFRGYSINFKDIGESLL